MRLLAGLRVRAPSKPGRLAVGVGVILLALVAAGCLVWAQRRAVTPDRPNVVLIVADDERFSQWWAHYQSLGASPGPAYAVLKMEAATERQAPSFRPSGSPR